MPSRRAISALGASACLALLTLGPPANAGTASTGPASPGPASPGPASPGRSLAVGKDGWIVYPTALARAGLAGTAATRTLHGTVTKAGGCRRPALTGTAPAGATHAITYTEEIAFQPRTCTTKVATATVSPQTFGRLERAARGPAAALGSGGAQPFSRWLQTSYIDPIEITITSQRIGLRWTPYAHETPQVNRHSFKVCLRSGACLDDTYIVSAGESVQDTADGWSANAAVRFKNTDFAQWVVAILGPLGWAACAFPPSPEADFEHSETVVAHRSGAASWSTADTKSGACTNLVHHATATGTSN